MCEAWQESVDPLLYTLVYAKLVMNIGEGETHVEVNTSSSKHGGTIGVDAYEAIRP